MGVVYEAEQESLGRRVALKVMAGHRLSDPMLLARFAREAKAAARLHHTNIVPVFGVGEAEGVHYYVMQFIQGQGLNAVLNELKRLEAAPTGAAATTKTRPGRGLGGRPGAITPGGQVLLRRVRDRGQSCALVERLE
jgi:serine/threonine protein kinase